MSELRLGDIIDDFCIKCRRLTNHAIVSLLDGKAAKVRCRTCYNDHDYRHEQAPPSKKELKKQEELYNAVLAGNLAGTDGTGATAAGTDPAEIAAVADAAVAEAPVPAKKTRGRVKRA